MNASADTVYLTMLSGKILDFVNSEIDGATFTKAGQAGADGIYHVITTPLIPRQSLWEYMVEHADEAQQAFILGLNNYNLYDTAFVADPEDIYLNNQFHHQVGAVRDEPRRSTTTSLDIAAFAVHGAELLT